MKCSAVRLALGFTGALAVAGCGSASAGNAAADTVAQRVVRCLSGRDFWYLANRAAPQKRARLGAIHAEAAVTKPGAGDAGFVEATIPLSYDVDAAGARILATHHLCAPGVRCFPTSVTAELFPADAGGFDYSVALVDTFASYTGGRALALAPRDLHSGRPVSEGGCG